ncbi:MAG: hypothetical protein IT176_06200 [Acidobacteria bacterium]|nr:hypothetical protein [Acidobacteriota bacterium]
MQRQLRLGDILDDYCPRERRVTNHAIVAMLGSDVKQTRCTTCDAEHEYKQARVPRQRRKADSPASLQAAVLRSGPTRLVHHGDVPRDDAAAEAAEGEAGRDEASDQRAPVESRGGAMSDARRDSARAGDLGGADLDAAGPAENLENQGAHEVEEGPVHRPLIRASLPRPEGTPPPPRPGPDFTIRQPGRPPNRFRGRHQRGGQVFGQGRGNGSFGGGSRGGGRHGSPRPQGGEPSRFTRQHGDGRKRSK